MQEDWEKWDFKKIKQKIYDYCYTLNSMAKKLGIYPLKLGRMLSKKVAEDNIEPMRSLLHKIALIMEISYEELIS